MMTLTGRDGIITKDQIMHWSSHRDFNNSREQPVYETTRTKNKGGSILVPEMFYTHHWYTSHTHHASYFPSFTITYGTSTSSSV